MTTPEIILIGACVVLVLLPPKWDPAIRIKEWQIKRGWHPESPTKESQMPTPPVSLCRVRRWSDEMVCTTPGCGIRYDANDPDPPKCPRTKQRLPEIVP